MKIIGIDLGTTNSVLCEYSRGKATVVPIDGKPTVPSVVFIEKDGNQVGHSAKKRILINPDQILSSTKRHIGKSWKKEILGKKYNPIDAAKMVLAYMKEEAEKTLGGPVKNVVITIPAYFDDAQRRETKLAAEEAGLNVLRLLPEPTAAAITYGFEREKDQTILVVDLGGGTFDVSILEVNDNEFIVKGVDGNSELGGDDFDLAIVDYLNEWIEENSGKSATKDKIAQQKLKEIAEEVKISLSSAKTAEIYASDIIPGVNIEIERFTRKEFGKLISKHLKEIQEKTQNVLDSAGLSIDDINRIVLVGGSCKHPLVQDLITEKFKAPFISDNMDTCVAEGAAIVCGSLQSLTEDGGLLDEENRPVDLVFKDVVSHSLGIDMMDSTKKKSLFGKLPLIYVPIVSKNTHYPCKGVALGFAKKWQEFAEMGVFRGEDDDPSKNEKLGKLLLAISRKNIGEKDNCVAAIFELDKDMILTFTGVEMPLNMDTIPDLGPIIEKAASDNNLIAYEEVQPLIKKHSFLTKEVKIKL